MKFYTENQYDIDWLHHPEKFELIADTVERIVDAGRWEEFLQLHQDDEGAVDCDALYDYLSYESGDALQDVGLHNNEATATVDDVLKAWEEENAPYGLRVSRDAHGNPSECWLYDHGTRCGGISLEFESVDAEGEVDSVSLDADDVFDLLRFRISRANNATRGEWSGTDESDDVFEMWRARD